MPKVVDTGTIRCICQVEEDDGFTIQCEKCLVWQHAACFKIEPENVPEQYFCEECEPRELDIQFAMDLQRKPNSKQKKKKQSLPTASNPTQLKSPSVAAPKKKKFKLDFDLFLTEDYIPLFKTRFSPSFDFSLFHSLTDENEINMMFRVLQEIPAPLPFHSKPNLKTKSIYKTGYFLDTQASPNDFLVELKGILYSHSPEEESEMVLNIDGFPLLRIVHPKLDLYLDTTKFGSEARAFRLSCRPNADFFYCLVPKQKDVERKDELKLELKEETIELKDVPNEEVKEEIMDVKMTEAKENLDEKETKSKLLDKYDIIVGVFATEHIQSEDEILVPFPGFRFSDSTEEQPKYSYSSEKTKICSCQDKSICLFNQKELQKSLSLENIQNTIFPSSNSPLPSASSSSLNLFNDSIFSAGPLPSPFQKEDDLLQKPLQYLTREEKKLREEILRFARMEAKQKPKKEKRNLNISSLPSLEKEKQRELIFGFDSDTKENQNRQPTEEDEAQEDEDDKEEVVDCFVSPIESISHYTHLYLSDKMPFIDLNTEKRSFYVKKTMLRLFMQEKQKNESKDFEMEPKQKEEIQNEEPKLSVNEGKEELKEFEKEEEKEDLKKLEQEQKEAKLKKELFGEEMSPFQLGSLASQTVAATSPTPPPIFALPTSTTSGQPTAQTEEEESKGQKRPAQEEPESFPSTPTLESNMLQMNSSTEKTTKISLKDYKKKRKLMQEKKEDEPEDLQAVAQKES